MNFLEKSADEIFGLMVTARRHFHENPELSQKEEATRQYIMDFLNRERIPYREIADTGLVAEIKGKAEGKVVAFRADMDALAIHETNACQYASKNAGVMHACGHDAHMAILMGVCKFFNDYKEQFTGTVKAFFQPAEETVGGAKRMVEQGCMDNPAVDYVLGLHVMPHLDYNQAELKYGILNASTDGLEITVRGKSGHGAYPDKCVDAIVISAQILNALQTVVSRNISPLDSAVFTVGKISGGTKGNIIANRIVMDGTIRSSSPVVRKVMLRRVEAIAKGVAAAMGGDCAIKFMEDGYPALVNDADIMDVVKEAAWECLGDENIFFKETSSMGGEDFSFFAQRAKAGFYHIGCRLRERPEYILHTDCFDIDERCLKTGLKMQVLSGLKLLEK